MSIKLIEILALTFLLIFFLPPNYANAIVDPLAQENNIFGIHILDENDLEDAARLVNSNGGDWGYVTLVIRSDERDHKRWQRVFDKMRELRLIPIVRVATKMQADNWEKPNFDELDGWVSFLNELNWVIQNRYIVVGNEPNHAKEWGGEVNPWEYANYLEAFSKKLKTVSSDFFILPAGFDASAPNSKDTMDEERFLSQMLAYKPSLFENIDGWASHSYPNPDFSGSQDEKGRGTVKTFEWEIKILKKLGVKKKLPVFITETGWMHNRQNGYKNGNDIEEVTKRLKASYELAWNDERIVAVTPFILNYQHPPFDVFSWKKENGEFYQFYYEVKDLPKQKGKPKQLVAVDILTIIFPPIIPNNGWFMGIVALKNQGQTIWEEIEKIFTSYKGFEIVIEPKKLFQKIRPGEKTIAIIKVRRLKN